MALPPDLDIGQNDAQAAKHRADRHHVRTEELNRQIDAAIRAEQKRFRRDVVSFAPTHPTKIESGPYRAGRALPDNPIGLIDWVPEDVLPYWLLISALCVAGVALMSIHFLIS